MKQIHDCTLLSINIDWCAGVVILEFRGHHHENFEITAFNFLEINVPRRLDWGESFLVNKFLGPDEVREEFCEISIEIQSGDVIKIVAKSFSMPIIDSFA